VYEIFEPLRRAIHNIAKLPLENHVYYLNAVNGYACGCVRKLTHGVPGLSFYPAVILFNNVVGIFYLSQPDIRWQLLLCLQLFYGNRIRRVFIYRHNRWISVCIKSFGEKPLGRLCSTGLAQVKIDRIAIFIHGPL